MSEPAVLLLPRVPQQGGDEDRVVTLDQFSYRGRDFTGEDAMLAGPGAGSAAGHVQDRLGEPEVGTGGPQGVLVDGGQ
ncbi:hypothetical protein OG778_30370 [Streptomyces sp. NBC_00184]|uniref:hypothetical protein n=1 Tax=Streptomyces sp. NBC_00184 TaxID=2975673 RepID=UPI002E291F37|nr:hypothetical protein [Streptomyces sp. NBC_00184]